MDFTQQHEVSHDHQSFDMVGVSVGYGFLNDVVYGNNTRGSIPETLWKLVTIIPMVVDTLKDALTHVNRPDKFAPAQYLADKPL